MAGTKDTIAIEEAVLNPDGVEWYAKSAALYAPGQNIREHELTKRAIDIHEVPVQVTESPDFVMQSSAERVRVLPVKVNSGTQAVSQSYENTAMDLMSNSKREMQVSIP